MLAFQSNLFENVYLPEHASIYVKLMLVNDKMAFVHFEIGCSSVL